MADKLKPGDPDYRPARGYKWETAKPGNTLALKHGAHSARVYQPVARELAEGIVAERSYLADYPSAVSAWAEAEARALLLREWIANQGMFGDDGEPRGTVLKWLNAFEGRARELRRDLGLDPRADAELAKTRAEAHHAAADLDAVRAAGREALRRRQDADALPEGQTPTAVEVDRE